MAVESKSAAADSLKKTAISGLNDIPQGDLSLSRDARANSA
jgi:hypothetical protein